MTFMYYPSWICLWILTVYASKFDMDEQDKIYYYAKRGIITYIIMAGFFLVTNVGRDKWWTASIFWCVGLYLISEIGESIEYILLGYASIIFMSEYYEIPIYLYRIIMGTFLNDSDIVIILPKLCFIFFMLSVMHRLSFDTELFLTMLKNVTIYYIPIGTVIHYLLRHILRIMSLNGIVGIWREIMIIMSYTWVFLMKSFCIGFIIFFIYGEYNNLWEKFNGMEEMKWL